MGNKCSATPSFTSENLNDNDDGEPPDESGESLLTVTIIESKNLTPETVLGCGGGKHHALIRVVNSFNMQSYTKPLKYDNFTWHMPKRRFLFASNDPEGEIQVSLLQHNLPPLPAVPVPNPCVDNPHPPILQESNCRPQICSSGDKKKVVLAKMTIPISLVELKSSKHIDRWYTLDTPDLPLGVEPPQVRITLDFTYKPSRMIDSLDSLLQKYDIEDTIGTGVSVVKKAIHKHTKKEYAIKFLQKQIKGQPIPRTTLDNEIELLKSLSHSNIVQLYETLEDSSTIYLVLELIKGSDLFDISTYLGTLRPATVATLLTPLLSALSYLHSRGIVHHDIKPENIIIDYLQNSLKLTDFGSAKFSALNSDHKKSAAEPGAVGGTLNYMAPEVLLNMRGAHNVCDKAVDVWSIGVLTYLLISGNHPFDSNKINENFLNRIISGKFKFTGATWEKVPKECKDFIKKCLVVDPKKRSNVAELSRHPWIVQASASKKVTFFLKEEREIIEREKCSGSQSRSDSMTSLLELFANEGVSRS